MGSMNISLPDSLTAFVDEQVDTRGYETPGEYVRDLIRREQDRETLRKLLLDGAQSGPSVPADEDFFDGLRKLASDVG